MRWWTTSPTRLKTGSVKLYRVYAGVPSVVIGLPSSSPDDEPAYVY
jgi:hypothetical protein